MFPLLLNSLNQSTVTLNKQINALADQLHDRQSRHMYPYSMDDPQFYRHRETQDNDRFRDHSRGRARGREDRFRDHSRGRDHFRDHSIGREDRLQDNSRGRKDRLRDSPQTVRTITETTRNEASTNQNRESVQEKDRRTRVRVSHAQLENNTQNLIQGVTTVQNSIISNISA